MLSGCYAMFGLSLIIGMLTMTLIYGRLVHGGIPPVQAAPTVWITLGMIGQSITAANLLGNDAGEPVLRRDQVWLSEKDKEGATVLYPLTDYKPRKAENMERGYLQGRYGAIPYLGNFSLLGEKPT